MFSSSTEVIGFAPVHFITCNYSVFHGPFRSSWSLISGVPSPGHQGQPVVLVVIGDRVSPAARPGRSAVTPSPPSRPSSARRGLHRPSTHQPSSVLAPLSLPDVNQGAKLDN